MVQNSMLKSTELVQVIIISLALVAIFASVESVPAPQLDGNHFIYFKSTPTFSSVKMHSTSFDSLSSSSWFTDNFNSDSGQFDWNFGQLCWTTDPKSGQASETPRTGHHRSFRWFNRRVWRNHAPPQLFLWHPSWRSVINYWQRVTVCPHLNLHTWTWIYTQR